MVGLLIVDKDLATRKLLAELLIEEGYDVTVTSSGVEALSEMLKKDAQVVLLGSEFDDLRAVDLIPILKQVRKKLTIILVTDDVPLAVIRKVRKEGIFYHALKPKGADGREEICQAVRCAFATLAHNQPQH